MSLGKKIIIGIGVMLIVLVGYVSYIMLSTRSHSPLAVEVHEQDGISLQIEYCRPFKKERLIFGSMENGAILPYGKYWRLGANDATKLILDTSVDFGGQLLAKGSYSLYAFPEEKHWVIGVNSEADRSGASPPDFSKDVGRIKVPVVQDPNGQEQFTISVEENGSEALVVMQWDQTQVRIPVKTTN